MVLPVPEVEVMVIGRVRRGAGTQSNAGKRRDGKVFIFFFS